MINDTHTNNSQPSTDDTLVSNNDTKYKSECKALYENAVDHYVTVFESLTPDSMNALMERFTDNIHFIDPFNDVVGKDAVRKIFTDMFEKTDNPRFIVGEVFKKQHSCIILWTFCFNFKKRSKTINIKGCSHIHISADGRVNQHIDYWDPCQGIYEHLPFINKIFRWLRNQLTA